jgi:hypothetical protein
MVHLQRVHDVIGHPLAILAYTREYAGGNPKPRGGPGVMEIAHSVVSTVRNGMARSIESDLAEQVMLNVVPLRAAGRIVTYRHPRPQPVTELALELGFPHPGSPPTCRHRYPPG